jgi:NTP pyrophosphatase (non-canonical NTP hydrolase)
MEFSGIITRALEVREGYIQLEKKRYGTQWTNEEIALGFVGDVGDLAKLIMAVNNRRNIHQAKEKLSHELADCLWSIIVLANTNDIDIEQAFLQTMDEIEGSFKRVFSKSCGSS